MFAEKLLASVGKADMIANSSDPEEFLDKFVPVGMINGAMGMQKPQNVITDLGKALLQAAKTGNTEKVHELMSRGAPFTADWLGTSPLHLAARHNHVDTCKVLLRAGISKDSKTKVDRTPLHFAAYQGNTEIVELLLNNKCEVDAKDMLKMTALHWAVEKRHDKIVEMLLQHGADPNALSKFGKTPISIATDAGQVDLVRILLLANQMRAASRDQVQEATENLMFELKQHKERDNSNMDDTEDNITMDLSNDGSISNMSSHRSAIDHHDTNTNDTDHLIEKEDSLSDAIINLEQNTETDPKNLDSNTLQMLKEHGIAMIPSDDSGSSLITSAIQSGRKIVLSEAGKFALNETRLQSGSVGSANSVPSAVSSTTKKTIKIIKKSSPYVVPQHHQGQHRQPFGHGHVGGGGTIKTNKVIKILSAEEFKQICGGEVGGIKKMSSADYKKGVQSAAGMKVTPTIHRSMVSVPSSGTKQIKKIVMTKNRLPSGLGASENVISKYSSVNSFGSSSNSNGLSSSSFNNSNSNRHIITSADGVKRLRTSAGMEVISKLPAKIPQDTVVSVENNSAINSGLMPSRQSSGIVPVSSVPASQQSQPQTQRAVSSNSNPPSNLAAVGGSSTSYGELERPFLEMKKQFDDLRKQFELLQKQNDEYRAKVDKLEKEVQILKQSSSNNPNNFIEIV